MHQIKRAGVLLAREGEPAARVRGGLRGAHTGLLFETTPENLIKGSASQAFLEQCQALVEAGVDALLLETY